MDADGHVLVIGAANLDIKGMLLDAPVRGSSVRGSIRVSPGGVARNLAENLVRLDVETILLTAVGDDDGGERILGQSVGSGIDISEALIVEGARTGAYMGFLREDGTLEYGIDDMSIMEHLTPNYFDERRHLFESASAVVVDANIRAPGIERVIALAREAQVPIYGDPATAALAERLRPFLPQFNMIAPNAIEAQSLLGYAFDLNDVQAAVEVAAQFVSHGTDMAIIALGERGVVYAGEETRGHIPAMQTQIVDTTGAGDAMMAAIIFGLREEIPLDECVRLGVTAASLTLRSRETVRPDLSIDLIYDELAI